jgi:catechol 2,3-dioxygenase-like lactoylglutathione lyase family enzyme
MTQEISRRKFLALTGRALVVSEFARGAESVPAMFDHMILGVDDLDRGIAFMEERTGVRAVFGGVHPGRGTRNALLALGGQRYLEIIAPDPRQHVQSWFPELPQMREPRLLGWAIHTGDIAALAKKVRDAGFPIQGPADGSRARPDGKMLRWKSFRLEDDRGGLLPFFIEWSRGSVHPSADAPAGCRLTRLLALAPQSSDLAAAYGRLGVAVAVERGEKAQLRLWIADAKGEVELTS